VTDATRARLWMLGAVLSFCALAVATKELVHTYSTAEIIALRAFVSILVLCVTARRLRPRILNARPRIQAHLTRSAFHLLGQSGWTYGIATLSLAEVTTLEFTMPLWVVCLAPLLLSEKPTSRVVLPALAGFAGVAIIAGPGADAPARDLLFVLLSTSGYALAHIWTKRLLTGGDQVEVVSFMSAFQLVSASLWAWCTARELVPPDLSLLMWIVSAGLSGLFAHFALAVALKHAPITQIIGLDYVRLPIMALLGSLLYAQPLNAWFILGAAVIVASGYALAARRASG
jgi:drug/metabolite transporter (DMT)-like permease